MSYTQLFYRHRSDSCVCCTVSTADAFRTWRESFAGRWRWWTLGRALVHGSRLTRRHAAGPKTLRSPGPPAASQRGGRALIQLTITDCTLSAQRTESISDVIDVLCFFNSTPAYPCSSVRFDELELAFRSRLFGFVGLTSGVVPPADSDSLSEFPSFSGASQSFQ